MKQEEIKSIELYQENIKHMEYEIISLASRNSTLEKEKDDLNSLLQQSNYSALSPTNKQVVNRLNSVRGGHGYKNSMSGGGGDFLLNEMQFNNNNDDNNNNNIQSPIISQIQPQVINFEFENEKSQILSKTRKMTTDNFMQTEINQLNNKNKQLEKEKAELSQIVKNNNDQIYRMQSLRDVKSSFMMQDMIKINKKNK